MSSPTLWRDAGFRRLWAGQTASQLGEHTSLTLLPLIAVLTLGVGADQLGLLRAVGQAPLLLLTLVAGMAVDRWRTRTVMVVADLGRALALTCVAALALRGGLDLPALLVVAVAVGALSAFFDVAYQASLVRLIARPHLLRATSAVEGTRSAAQLGGPALAGTLMSLVSAPLAAAAGALFFVASLTGIARIREPRPLPSPAPGGLTAGVRFVATHPLLRTVCLASAAFQFCFAALMTAYLLFLPRDLGLSGAAIGVVLTATGAGALAGSLLAARLPARYGHGPVVVLAALLGDGVLLLVPALHGGPAFVLAALLTINLVFGALGQLVNVTLLAVRQAVTPAPLQGRVTAAITFAGMGMTPLGSLTGGWLAAGWGLRPALAVTAAGMLLSPLLMALSPLARLGRDLPGPGSRVAGGAAP